MTRTAVPDVEKLSNETRHLYDVLNHESDLACVLIAHSYLDYALASLLKHYFVESAVVKKLLDSPGALAAFAARCDLAYCLGLIPKDFYQNLVIVGRIRNEFAHSYLPLELDLSENIAKLVDSLVHPTFAQALSTFGDEDHHPGLRSLSLGSPRARFNTTVAVMVNRLLLKGLETKHRKNKAGRNNVQR